MRDPARIEEMISLLREVWESGPDMRLGQLIFNAARCRHPDIEDVFSIEDGEMRKGLVRLLEIVKKPAESSGASNA